jgi:hypothetical protein
MITEKEQAIGNRKVQQGSIFNDALQKGVFDDQVAKLKSEIEQLKELRKTIVAERKLPFSYDVDFMEVFIAKDDPGFDLIIGNPPYVQYGDILPPEDGEYLEFLMKIENKAQKAEQSKNFKDALSEKVYNTYEFLSSKAKTTINGKQKAISIYGDRVPGRSDLYAYFQLICPAYLNNSGTFCFIISSSWLDVGFGVYIQHFLLKHTKLYNIYDSTVRSFNAKVNTIIYLHSSIINKPRLRGGQWEVVNPVDNLTRFVKNKMDYVDAAYAPLLVEQEHSRENVFGDLYRLIVKNQVDLFNAGNDNEERTFIGEKWSSKYLKMPEKIVQLYEHKWHPLDTYGTITLGLTSCNNDFFYLTEEVINEYLITPKYLQPILKSPQESDCVTIYPDRLNTQLLTISEKEIVDKTTNNYLKYGEKNGVNLGECLKGRRKWYSFSFIPKSNIFLPYSYGDKFRTFYCSKEIACDKRLVSFVPSDGIDSWKFALNSTLWFLLLEIFGSSNMGEGALVFNTKDFRKIRFVDASILRFKDDQLKDFLTRPIKSILVELGFDKNIPIREQKPKPLPDRMMIDKVIFDSLNLNADERNEVYWATAELVKQRIDKAASR